MKPVPGFYHAQQRVERWGTEVFHTKRLKDVLMVETHIGASTDKLKGFHHLVVATLDIFDGQTKGKGLVLLIGTICICQRNTTETG